MKYALFVLLIICCLPSYSQVRRSSGSYDLNLSQSNLSEDQACRKCQELAMVKAIEARFGTVMIQGNTMILRSTNGVDSVVSDQSFLMLAESYVNGQWLETLESSCDRQFYEGDFWLHCEVKGKVASLTEPDFDLTFFAADCEDPGCKTWEFDTEEDFYLHFTSAVKGYLSVYLSDGDLVQRLLPYRQIPAGWEGGMPVTADNPYVLFSRSHEVPAYWTYVDEYVWDVSEAGQLHRIYLVFSESPHGKPILSETQRSAEPWPHELGLPEFQAWLARQRKQNQDLLIQMQDVMIRS